MMITSECTSSFHVDLHIAALHYGKLLRQIFDGTFHEALFPAMLRNATKRNCGCYVLRRETLR